MGIFAVIDNIYTIHFYLKRDESMTQTEILLSTLAVMYLIIEVVLFYGLLRNIPKLILTWIIIEAVGLTAVSVIIIYNTFFAMDNLKEAVLLFLVGFLAMSI